MNQFQFHLKKTKQTPDLFQLFQKEFPPDAYL